MRIFFLILYIILGVIDSYASEHHRSRICKPAIMPCLILWMFLSEGMKHPVLMAAELCGWAGDVLLICKGRSMKKNGAFMFLIGNILYCICFIRQISWMKVRTVYALAVLPYIGSGLLIFQKVLRDQKRSIQTAASIYMFCIGMMSFLSMLLCLCESGKWMIWAGTVSFIISDALILVQNIRKQNQKGVMETYLAAQFLITYGMVM